MLPTRLCDPLLKLEDIFIAGDAALLEAPTVGIVGSRDASIDARHFAAELARAANRAGYVVVSGGARGIDLAAHEAAERTICVVASSLTPITPEITATLCTRILERGGAVVSEHGAGAQVHKGFFLERNRIVAALSDVVIVAAARRKSGSLHTAKWAQKLGRPLWIVPGPPWDTRMLGGNGLIASGDGMPITSAREVELLLRERRVLFDDVAPPPLDPIEALLSLHAHTADELCAALSLPPERLPLALRPHVISGRIVHGVDGRYRLVEL